MSLYLPSCFFIFINFTTNLIAEKVELVYWGYKSVHGILFFVFALYMIGYFISSFYLCYKFYLKEASKKEKIQTKFLMIAITIPLVGGTIFSLFSIFWASILSVFIGTLCSPSGRTIKYLTITARMTKNKTAIPALTIFTKLTFLS